MVNKKQEQYDRKLPPYTGITPPPANQKKVSETPNDWTEAVYFPLTRTIYNY